MRSLRERWHARHPGNVDSVYLMRNYPLRHEEQALSAAVAEARRLDCEDAATHLLVRLREVLDLHDLLGDDSGEGQS